MDAQYYLIDANRSVKLENMYNEQYAAGGLKALIDHIRGTDNFRTGAWQGYHGVDLIATVDLGATKRINRLAGILEMADDEFSRIRSEITDYRRRVQQLVQNGKLDDVQLDGDTFNSYLQARPFDALNKRIAAINQAEITEVPLIRYLRVFLAFGCKTLGDVQRLVKQYEEDAYRLARHQLGNTDLDIISSAVGVQNICIVCILATGGGKMGLVRFFDAINGHNTHNEDIAEMTFNLAKSIQL